MSFPNIKRRIRMYPYTRQSSELSRAQQRKPSRWDLYAERFAVAMTLYEMGTGTLPTWGDGLSDAAMLECEVSLEDETRAEPKWLSVDVLACRVVPARAYADDRGILMAWLGLAGEWQRGVWPAQQDVAERLAVPRQPVQAVLERAREHWSRQRWMTAWRSCAMPAHEHRMPRGSSC
ncbi:MAG: hypothetical protein ACREOH_11350 [Candidatus Entotheonellia bacterium]